MILHQKALSQKQHKRPFSVAFRTWWRCVQYFYSKNKPKQKNTPNNKKPPKKKILKPPQQKRVRRIWWIERT